MAAALSLLLGCTVKDPTYCDEDIPCEPGFQCNLANKTCYPVDAGVDGPLSDAARDAPRPDVAPPDVASPDTAPPLDSIPDGSKPDGSTPGCATKGFLSALGKTRLLTGAQMEDSVAKQAPFDLRYLYLSGGIFDGTTPCTSCATQCSVGGVSCAGGACEWWGCWQWDKLPPGEFAREFFAKVQKDGQIPMISYRQIRSSGVERGKPEITVAAPDVTFMQRYYADWRFALQQIKNQTVLLHIEPNFWGHAQSTGSDPTKIKAAVASANPTDCASRPNTIAGMGRCMIAMVRKYAPNAKVGLHANTWGTGIDVNINKDVTLDVVAEANKVGAFLAGCGAGDGDFVVVEVLDGDAGYYEKTEGENLWWDATNATLPNFNQHFTWAKALAEKVGLPLLWWQVPVGNMSLPNKTGQYKDNRVDYFFSHTKQLADAYGVGMAFGTGVNTQTTTPSSDNGNLVNKVKAYVAAGGQPPFCP